MDHKLSKSKLIYYASLVLFFISLGLVFVAITNGVIDHHLFFNSDALYLATIHKTIWVDGFSFASFKFPDAPFFFPDFIIFILFFTLTKSYLLSNILTAYLTFSLVFILLYKLSTYFIPKKHYHKKSLIFSGLSLMLGLIAQNKLFLHIFLLISPVFHEGELLIVLLCLVIIFELLKRERIYLLFLLFVLVTLVTFADKSVVKDFTAPMIAVITATYLFARELYRKLAKSLYVMVGATFLGSLLYSITLPFPKPFPGITNGISINMSKLLGDIGSFFTAKELSVNVASKVFYFGNYMGLFTLLLIVAFITMGIVAVKYIFKVMDKEKPSPYENMFFMLGIFLLAQSFLNFIATIFFGYYRGIVHIRYFTPLTVFPYLWLLLFIGNYVFKKAAHPGKYLLYTSTSVLLIGFIVDFLFFAKIKPGGLKNFYSYKPPNTECIDQIARENHLTYGVSELWNYVNTLLSEEGVIIHHLGAQGPYIVPSHWLSSYEWYLKKSPENEEFPDYSFFVTDRFEEENIISVLGEPKKVYDCPTSRVFIYDPETMKRVFEGPFKARYFFDQLTSVGNKAEIPAGKFNDYIFDPQQKELQAIEYEITPDQKLTAAGNEQGLLVFGPLVTLKKGTYRMEIYYQADRDKVGALQIFSSPPDNNQQSLLNNTNGQPEIISATVEVGKNMRKITTNPYNVGILRLVVTYSGEGNLTLEKMVIERVQ